MRTRGMFLFLLVNIIVTVGVAYLVINFVGAPEQDPSTMPFRTVEVIITATRDPNATPAVRIITATPPEGQIAAIPTGVLDDVNEAQGANGSTDTPDDTTNASPTLIDDAAFEANPELLGTVSALPENCTIHSLEEGEFPGLVAEIYGVSVFDILAVNGLTEDDAIFLQIGDPLIIPLAGCALLNQISEDTTTTDDEGSISTATPEGESGEPTEPAETPTPEATLTPSITPTITLEPTAENAQVEILEVLSAGDVTAEAIVIFNNGRTVDLTNWTLADIDGNVYTFSDQLLFNQGRIEIFTRVGESTTVRKFWGLNEAVWGESGDIVTLRDAEGAVQAIFRLP